MNLNLLTILMAISLSFSAYAQESTQTHKELSDTQTELSATLHQPPSSYAIDFTNLLAVEDGEEPKLPDECYQGLKCEYSHSCADGVCINMQCECF